MEPAPYHEAIADAPAGGAGHWLRAADGVRLRIVAWPHEGARGTVLIFCGRTEYAEKYGRAAVALARRGYASLAVDWRGQGLADRLLDDPSVGHVRRFGDYQLDVAAVFDAARGLALPAPFHVIGHSMGGCIALRATMQGAPVVSAVFTGPMWGIQFASGMRSVAWTLSTALRPLGMGGRRSPGTPTGTYVLDTPFEDNTLTRDRETWNWMAAQIAAEPDLALGGPSIGWLNEALREMRHLAGRPSPALPCLTFLGTNERIVDPHRIAARMAAWPGGHLEMVEDGEHEVLMEVPTTRERIFDRIAAHLDAATPARAA
ncbi:MAG: alpha/beta hydrolase [Shimia sp.]